MLQLSLRGLLRQDGMFRAEERFYTSIISVEGWYGGPGGKGV